MAKTGRNDDCYCGSTYKYKNCCLNKDQKKQRISLFNTFSVLSGYTSGQEYLKNRFFFLYYRSYQPAKTLLSKKWIVEECLEETM